MTSEVTIGTAIDSQSKTAAANTQLSQDFADFLNLLTVQLQHQDPMDPMDTKEFTNQIVAFTGVEQQINTNQKLDDLVALQLGTSMGNALGYVGLDISYISSEFYFDGSTPSTINYALEKDAVEVTVRVLDEEGNIVYEEDGDRNVGNNEFTWDGTDKHGDPVEPGTYEVRIDALDIEDEAVGATTVVNGRVSGVETQNGLLFAIVGDRAVALSNILNATQPVTTVSNDNSDTPDTTTDDTSSSDDTSEEDTTT